nr:MAG TPA: hypothetical protein [Caudoviricetes sp.]
MNWFFINHRYSRAWFSFSCLGIRPPVNALIAGILSNCTSTESPLRIRKYFKPLYIASATASISASHALTTSNV